MEDCNLYGRAFGLNERGRHKNLASALDAAFADLLTEHDPFFDSLADRWSQLFPGLPIRPGRYDCGKIVLYVANAPLSFMMRPKLRMIKARLAKLPDAPRRLDLRLEIHAT